MAFSNHMGRGTEIIYEGYGLKQPKSIKTSNSEKVATPINEEQFPEYIGDIAVIAQQGNKSPQFEQTQFWKSLNAVKTSCH